MVIVYRSNNDITTIINAFRRFFRRLAGQDGYKAGRDNAKFMGISVPTAAGKTFILPYLFDELRKLDPEVKFIIATSQNVLIQDIHDKSTYTKISERCTRAKPLILQK